MRSAIIILASQTNRGPETGLILHGRSLTYKRKMIRPHIEH
jgi:hypothetical protein